VNVKKIAIFDQDDVINMWILEFNKHLISLGYDLGPDKEEYIPKNWGYTEIGVPYKIVQNYIHSCPNHAPYKEMVNCANRLKNRGWEIVVVTSHPSNLKMERIKHLNTLGLNYDHIALTQSFDKSGEVVSLSKAKYIEAVYKRLGNILIFVDDRMKSVIEFVEMGLGHGFSLDRAYNSKEMERLQESPLLERRIHLGRGPTMEAQILDLIPKIEDVAESLSTKLFVALRR
jgi:hypothetical protein